MAHTIKVLHTKKLNNSDKYSVQAGVITDYKPQEREEINDFINLNIGFLDSGDSMLDQLTFLIRNFVKTLYIPGVEYTTEGELSYYVIWDKDDRELSVKEIATNMLGYLANHDDIQYKKFVGVSVEHYTHDINGDVGVAITLTTMNGGNDNVKRN